MCYKTTSGEYDQKKKKINEVHFNIGNKFMITQWVGIVRKLPETCLHNIHKNEWYELF